MYNEILPEKIADQMMKDRKIRTAIVQKSHLYFFYLYFAHYVQYEIAPFQRELFSLSERKEVNNLFVVAFRGSAKSTIFTLSYPLWAILGEQQVKFVLILCQTRVQAKQHMMNLKRELENNQLLKNDLGPFQEESDEWGSSSMVFSNLNARITAASSEQSIRGIRHNQYRPGLIIGDDVEDISSSKTREGRDKTYQWLTSEVIPCGDINTKLVIIGNLLHEDSLLMRLKRNLEEGRIEGIFKEYPLLDESGNCSWLGKYPNAKAIENEKKKVGNEIAWQREYLLRIIPAEDQVIHREWIHYYEGPIPEKCRIAFLGVDLAISEKASADCTAIVSVAISGYEKDFKAYILPHPINKRMDFLKTIKQIEDSFDSLKKNCRNVRILVESVGYQAVVTQMLANHNYPAEDVRISSDKHSRLMTLSHLIQEGKIVFPKHGSEELVQQLVGFGVERHDDLVDAFTILGQKIIEEDKVSTHYPFSKEESERNKCDSILDEWVREKSPNLLDMIF